MTNTTLDEAAARVRAAFEAFMEQVGNMREQFSEPPTTVDVELWFHDGQEAILLHDLTGEGNIEIYSRVDRGLSEWVDKPKEQV